MKIGVKGCLLAVPFLFIGFFVFYIFFGQEYVYAKRMANELLEYKVPDNTNVLKQDFDYGVLYGGGPWGSGGRPTVVAYQKLSTELSEREIAEHYNRDDFEIYFAGNEELKENSEGKIWYEGTLKNQKELSSKNNEGQPLEVIIQYRTEFSFPFFIDFY